MLISVFKGLKLALRKYLNTHPFYTVDELAMFKKIIRDISTCSV
jgi:hypothetical protein